MSSKFIHKIYLTIPFTKINADDEVYLIYSRKNAGISFSLALSRLSVCVCPFPLVADIRVMKMRTTIYQWSSTSSVQTIYFISGRYHYDTVQNASSISSRYYLKNGGWVSFSLYLFVSVCVVCVFIFFKCFSFHFHLSILKELLGGNVNSTLKHVIWRFLLYIYIQSILTFRPFVCRSIYNICYVE